MALAFKAMFTSGGYDAFFERTRGIHRTKHEEKWFQIHEYCKFAKDRISMFMCIQFSYIWVDKKKENLSIEIVMVIEIDLQ